MRPQIFFFEKFVQHLALLSVAEDVIVKAHLLNLTQFVPPLRSLASSRPNPQPVVEAVEAVDDGLVGLGAASLAAILDLGMHGEALVFVARLL